MKNIIFLLIFSSMTIMLPTSCEQSELRKADESPILVVVTRSIEDCEECPVEDCCCTIVIIPPFGQPIPPITLDFCGTTSPGTSTPCSATGLGICDDITGNKEVFMFGVSVGRAQFCAALNQTFGITSTLPYLPGYTLAITCQDAIFPPQTVYIDLGTTGNKPFWQLGGECVLETCF